MSNARLPHIEAPIAPIPDLDAEPFRLRMRTINHIEERLSKTKHKKDKSIFLSDEAWALVLAALKAHTP